MFKSINNSLYEIILNIFNEKDKNSIIEPLICLTRLAILEFKPVGTKISIFNNKITYNEPNILQGAVRWSNGDARDDLHNIYLPITKASKWYDVKHEDIKNIFRFSIRGLEKLKKSYSKNSTINHSLQYYIDCLRNSLNTGEYSGYSLTANEENNYNGEQSDTNSRSNRSKRNKNRQTDNDNSEVQETANRDNEISEEEEQNTIFNKLKGIWNNREISIINNLLIEMEEKRGKDSTNNIFVNDDDAESIITTLETILSNKEKKVSDLIIKSTTLLE